MGPEGTPRSLAKRCLWDSASQIAAMRSLGLLIAGILTAGEKVPRCHIREKWGGRKASPYGFDHEESGCSEVC